MTGLNDTNFVFDRLMVLGAEVFEAGRYMTVYHILAAALLEAERDALCLCMVLRVAEEHVAWLSTPTPQPEQPALSIDIGGPLTLFTMLASHARAKLLLATGAQKLPSVQPREPYIATLSATPPSG
jgi:hypothetical protein